MPPADATANTPLAPSVEKAYYRKCIELKRRLNEVEAANDEAKLRRVRLDRGIMKMRLERAYLLDELRKRMEANVDESEGSGEEALATPPVDRPHRDKRRRHNPPAQPTGPIAQAPPPPTGIPRQSSQPDTVPSQPYAARSGAYPPSAEYAAAAQQQPAPSNNTYGQNSPYAAQTPRPAGGAPRSFERRSVSAALARDTDGAADGDEGVGAVSRQAGAVGDALSAGPTVREGANGERRIASSEQIGGAREPEGSFTAVNS